MVKKRNDVSRNENQSNDDIKAALLMHCIN